MKKFIGNIITGIILVWVCLAVHQLAIYEEDVYDCSNMVADQEQFFDMIGIDTDVGIRYETEDRYAHAWLILPYDIPFECTILCILPFGHTPDVIFDNVDELIIAHPEAKSEFTLSIK